MRGGAEDPESCRLRAEHFLDPPPTTCIVKKALRFGESHDANHLRQTLDARFGIAAADAARHVRHLAAMVARVATAWCCALVTDRGDNLGPCASAGESERGDRGRRARHSRALRYRQTIDAHRDVYLLCAARAIREPRASRDSQKSRRV